MVFSSLLFLFRFLPLVLMAYYVLPKNGRNFVLFVSSLVFYAWGEPIYVVLILISSSVDYCAGRAVAYCKGRGYRGWAVVALWFSVLINLSLLGYFKYADFFVRGVNSLMGLSFSVPRHSLPIGISFYTFQTMSYTIDVYRGEVEVQKNFIDFGAYVALFPQLIAGPIIRYRDIANQLRERRETSALFSSGIIRFMTGLGKKVLIANQIGLLWNEAAGMDAGNLTTATAWLGVLAFTLQIYFDFSGYSDMAIGLGAMFGFSFPENFHYPYESRSVTEFWRRWHISLGTWFREYVYISLGGNRKGIARQMLNISVVWLLTGLWHGAHVNFVLWGAYYGVLLVLEKLLWKSLLKKVPAWLGHLYTSFFVMFGWSIFSWQDMADYAGYMKAMFAFGNAGIADRTTVYLLLSYFPLLLIAMIGSLSEIKNLALKYLPEGTYRREAAGLVWVILLFILCVAMLINSSYNPFLYFRF